MSHPNELRIKTEIARRFLEDLQLHGFAERTQESYMRAVRLLAYHYHKSPDQITEEELRQYFLHLKNDKKWSRASMTLSICGIKFFFEHTLKQNWATFKLVRPAPDKRLPTILTREEVRLILSKVRFLRYRTRLAMIYSCGLRLTEGTHLQVCDVDSSRMLLLIRHGKGGKDRYVPLPQSTLALLREYWKTHCNPTWIFPAPSRSNNKAASADRPMPYCNVQDAFRAALKESGLNKRAAVHTLRHSYATHLLEAGVNLRALQEYLGHNSLQTTARYTHLTEQALQQTHAALNQLMENLCTFLKTSAQTRGYFSRAWPGLFGEVRRTDAATSSHGHAEDYRVSHRSTRRRSLSLRAVQRISLQLAAMTKPTNGSRCKARSYCR